MNTQSEDRVGRRSFVLGAGALAAAAAPTTALIGALPAAAAPAALRPSRLPMPAGAPQQVLDPKRWETCLGLARELLMIGPEGQDLKLEYLRILIDNGLPAAIQPKDVVIVGAGISGLVAGLLLKRAGHNVTILEANANRFGGRIKTFRKEPRPTPRRSRTRASTRRPAPCGSLTSTRSPWRSSTSSVCAAGSSTTSTSPRGPARKTRQPLPWSTGPLPARSGSAGPR